MTQTRLATSGQRITSAIINLLIGMLPLSIPNIVFTYAQPAAGWARSDIFLDGLAIVLAFLQLLFVHKVQGSPGVAFAGLCVQYTGGSPPRVRTTLVRAVPYLVAVASSVLIPREGGSQATIGVFALILSGVVIFVAASGFTAFFTDGRSLMDRITGTELVSPSGSAQRHRLQVTQGRR